MNLRTTKALILIGSMGVFSIFGGGEVSGFTFENDLRQGLLLPTSEEITSRNTENPIYHFSRFYTEAFRKTLHQKHVAVAIYFNDLSNGHIMTSDNPWTREEAEAQAIRLAREALYVAIQDTVNDVQLLHRAKEYGRSLTSVEVGVKDGELDFEGPSLSNAGRGTEARNNLGHQDFFRSRLTVSAGVDLGLSWRTTLGPIESQLTYLVISDDIFDATLSKELTHRSKLNLTYRTASDEQKALVTLNFSLP